MAIKRSDANVLWGRSGARCAFPGCRLELSLDGGGGLIGEMAHIVAHRPEGPRGSSEIGDTERDEHPNLILMCPTHHTLIDKKEKEWTVERLQKAKKAHEAWVDLQLAKGFISPPTFTTIHYLNVPRVIFDLASQGIVYDFPTLDIGSPKGLRGLGFELGRVLVTFERIFRQNWRAGALPLDNPRTLRESNVGARVKFDAVFRTKNVPSPHEAEASGYSLGGDVDKDPQIYRKVGDQIVRLLIDPRWITTITAFVDFRPQGGSGRFAGLGILKHAHAQEALVTPLVIGLSPAGRRAGS